MNKALFAVAVLFFSMTVSADDFGKMAASCIGLDAPGTQQCMNIIARHRYAPLHKMRVLTLAEKTAIDAILAADPKAVIVVLPDGSVEIGQTEGDRLIGIPCVSLASCKE